MKVKICGMREAANILSVVDFNPDFLGFIFYEKSPRYVGDALDTEVLRALPESVGKVGVFVDAPLPELLATANHYSLDYVQLHGHETPAYCQAVHEQGLRIIKAFSIAEAADFDNLAPYMPYCELFLFDTKGAQPGGNGHVFDWQLLEQYHGATPFLLSGGLGPETMEELLRFHHPQLAGYDFNSQLELAPGLKDVEATGRMLTHLHEQRANF
ncbi:phosphoribosylanthranilate isomerase [Hymenobacter ginsengisoli]|uniref:N-(5'-phosphoribosyl)anthranilate isomerase n=1 Tax=Hymenobacter ginsengisoli TaxID=1051626 RepID=A0ABP8PZ89_9BACT|nr:MULTISPECIES: phosphoribosylanthranilate isomerase [unclassified Hymenobacter]MBO2030352.1 phosphoribosylanthranilate isomerase [Hymenobacter sp. BT559]